MVKKKGIVWNYFTKKVHGSQITAFCKFCDQSYIQNATRMEKHIERCAKCPQDVKRDFIRLVNNKKANSMITMKLAENWSIQQSQIIPNDTNCNRLQNTNEWEYTENFSNEVSDINTNDSVDIDSKEWNKNLPIESIPTSQEQSENQNWERVEVRENEPLEHQDEIQDSIEEPALPRRIHPNRRFSQLPLLSGRRSMNAILQNKIQQEQYLERRALRRLAELELQRKTFELEKLRSDYQIEKAQNELRWAHECRMMQMKEECQHQLLEGNRSSGQ